MPFISGLQGPALRPLHTSRAGHCMPCHHQPSGSRGSVRVHTKKIAATELRGLSDEEILQEVARSQFELVQLEWKVSRKEVGSQLRESAEVLSLSAEPRVGAALQAVTTSDFQWHRKHVRRRCLLQSALDKHRQLTAPGRPQIARLLTVKRERELKQGVDKRESRRRERWATNCLRSLLDVLQTPCQAQTGLLLASSS